MAIIKIKNQAIDLDAAEIPNLPASKITSGTFADARIADLAAAKLTGTIATARLGSGTASNTTFLRGDQSYQTLSEFNDDKLVNDISTLALHQATNNNSAKYNLTNSNVDVYQDSSAVANLTNVQRNTTGEYMSSLVTTFNDTSLTINNTNYTTYIKSDPRIYSSAIASSTEANFNNASDSLQTGSFGTKGANFFTSPSSATAWEYNNNRFTDDYRSLLIMELTYPMSFTGVSGRWRNGSGSSMAWHLYGIASDGYTQASPASYPNISQASGNSGGMVNGTTYTSAGTWNNTTKYPYAGIFVRHSSANAYMYDTLTLSGVAGLPTSTTSATGNYESTAQTANASVTKISGVVTYTNASGTANLNTDIVLQVSADNGSNYTNATLTPAGSFSSGVLQAVTNDISVTAGTQLKYKIFFANQAAGSKVTRINGVSLSY